ncbi:MAG: PorP/SprF family type IX secretion system membrane protein [Muribaculaceae bacterium]|nr:PorP/SprF family type IX secretion system membrane protein [Muribaculaceae bacterium]
MKHLICILVAAVLAVMPAAAQTDAQFTQFYEVPSIYNPAAIGLTDFVRLRGAGRLQWVGIDGAPRTFDISANMPYKVFNKRLGAGIVMQQESIGLYSSLNLNAQIGYKLRKFGGEFTGAIQIGMFDQRFKGSESYVPDGDDYHQGADDAIPTADLHGTALDLGAGIWFQHKLWHAGISATHLTAPTIRMGGESGSGGTDEAIYEFHAPRTLYFMAGCNIPIKNTLFELTPSLMVKSDFTFTGAEIMARARYNKFLSFGVGYRYDDAITATIAAEIKNFYIGYSFDYATSALHSASAGSHEVVVGYSLKLDLGEKNRNRHRSIRFM